MTPLCVVPTFRPYAAENLEFGGFYASSCESRVSTAAQRRGQGLGIAGLFEPRLSLLQFAPLFAPRVRRLWPAPDVLGHRFDPAAVRVPPGDYVVHRRAAVAFGVGPGVGDGARRLRLA